MRKAFLILGIAAVVSLVAVTLLRNLHESPLATTSTTPGATAEARSDTVSSQVSDAQPQASEPAHTDAPPQAPRPPGASPVPVDQSVARLVDSTNQLALGIEIPTLHRQLENEAKDPVRAAQLEYEIRTYLQVQAANGAYNVGPVECRTTLCEVQVTATSREARDEWSKVLADLRQQPWATSIASTVHSAQEDEATNTVRLVTILRLQQAQAQ